MKFTHLTVVLPLLASIALPCGLAHSEILSVQGESVIDLYRNFAGDDHAIFGGLDKGLDINFQFNYDTNAAITSIDGLTATYELDPTGSFISFGSSTMNFTSLSVRVGTNSLGSGVFHFFGHNDIHESTAHVQYSLNTPLGMDLPTSFNFHQADSYVGADYDHNQFLLSVITGWDATGRIVPAPGTLLFTSSGLLLMTRRRRAV